LWRVVADEEDIALIVAEADVGDDAQIGDATFRGRDDRRHVAEIAEARFASEHGIDDD